MDKDVLTYVSQFKIILLQETWMQNPFELHNYFAFHSCASIGPKGGRPAGGLSTFVSTDLGTSPIQLKIDKKWILAVKIFSTHFKIICINVYIHPLMKQTDLKNIWNELEDCILLVSNKFPSASLIIGGDFNARLGHSDEQLINESGMGPLNANDEHWPIFRRHSLDPVTNFAGTCLFLMALRLNLVILNGLSSGDCPGQFTYWSGLRHSVIDYILVSQELFNEYIEFTVDIRTESDHLPLNLKRTEFWEPSRCGLAPQTPDPNAPQQIGRSRIKWSPYVNNNFSIWTQSMEGQLLWADLTSNDTEETSPIDHYNTLIRKLQPLLSRLRRPNHNEPPTNKKWSDRECIQAKLILRECFKVFQQNPNPITKLELQLKKELQRVTKNEKKNRRLSHLAGPHKSVNRKRQYQLLENYLQSNQSS